jgi:4-hydroxy-3-methylbut-2-enyl diphosphate reductase
MKITLAKHYGMCFGVRDALRATHDLAGTHEVTILGQLVHNPAVDRQLSMLGVQRGQLDAEVSAPTEDVVITAHGASDADRQRWSGAGYRVTDTTCPLVHKAHNALRRLVEAGYHPVVIGQAGHVEVRGLTGDFPQAAVVLSFRDVLKIGSHKKIGIVSQTTQPTDLVAELVGHIRRSHPTAEVKFIDTVCQPTKDRQKSLVDLCAANEVVIVVGGANSNNTAKLASSAEGLGARAYHVEGPEGLRAEWFAGVENVGLTAGTSTLDETVDAVAAALKRIAADQKANRLANKLRTLVGSRA